MTPVLADLRPTTRDPSYTQPASKSMILHQFSAAGGICKETGSCIARLAERRYDGTLWCRFSRPISKGFSVRDGGSAVWRRVIESDNKRLAKKRDSRV